MAKKRGNSTLFLEYQLENSFQLILIGLILRVYFLSLNSLQDMWQSTTQLSMKVCPIFDLYLLLAIMKDEEFYYLSGHYFLFCEIFLF
jgi:hypothetical protein